MYDNYINSHFDQPPFWFSFSHSLALMRSGLFEESVKVIKGLNYQDVSLMNVLKSKVVLLYSLILASSFIKSKR